MRSTSAPLASTNALRIDEPADLFDEPPPIIRGRTRPGADRAGG
jgi:hypothetical protein